MFVSVQIVIINSGAINCVQALNETRCTTFRNESIKLLCKYCNFRYQISSNICINMFKLAVKYSAIHTPLTSSNVSGHDELDEDDSEPRL